MGESAIGWPDLWAYAKATGEISEPWEFRALNDMSRDYLTAKHHGENPLCIPPIEQEASE